MRRHRKWKLTRGEESDTDSGGESGGEVGAQFFYYSVWWHMVMRIDTYFCRIYLSYIFFIDIIRSGRMGATQTGT